jgi:hypothetical protein
MILAIHMAAAAVLNAVWDLYAKYEKKPLWKYALLSAQKNEKKKRKKEKERKREKKKEKERKKFFF